MCHGIQEDAWFVNALATTKSSKKERKLKLKHYQKIDKYKRKYRGNIFVGKFPRDFTDGNIPSVYTNKITVEKKFKTKQKKR
jgi:hypothetical protein